jgi:cellulose synthase (UDP-forming)
MVASSNRTERSWWIIAARSIVLLIAIGGLIACIPLPLVWTDQAVLGALLVGISIIISRFSRGRGATLTLTFVSLFCTFRYTYWRWTTTLRYAGNNGWQVDRWSLFFAFLLLAAEAYSLVVFVLSFFQSARPLQRRPVPLPDNPGEWPTVDVLIPTYNEPLDVVRPTVLAALGIDWPLDKIRVYLLDDGRRPAFRAFAEECGAEYITRFDNKHAKAGNINNALKKTSGEYIAIFDCDHIATRSFLQMTMGWFAKDQRLALVQTPHHFYSPDPFERNLDVFRKVPNEGALFYGIVQEGNDLWNASFFCGSCAVIRRKALEEIGGIAVETVTEDAHTSVRMQCRGWNTAFIGIPQAAGLATGSLAAHIGQRIRWARGMVQILRIDCPLFARGLKLAQRLCYFNAVSYYLFAIPRIVFLTAPLVYLLLGKKNLFGYVWEILAYAFPHMILAPLTNSRVQGRHRHSFWSEVYDTVLAPYIVLPTTLALINPKWGKFNVTSKSSIVDESWFDFKLARPYLCFIALNLVAIGIAVSRLLSHADTPDVLLMNVFWVVLNTLIAGTAVAVSTERLQRRSTVRVAANLPVRLSLPSGNAYDCRLVDISEGGLALRSERIVDLRPGTHAEVIVRCHEADERFLVQMVESGRNLLRFQFSSADLEQQRALTRIVYSRADSWLNWTEGQQEDRVLRSLFALLFIGVKGLLSIPGGLIDYARRESKESKSNLAAATQAAAPLIIFAIWLFMGPAVSRASTTLSFQDKQDLSALSPNGAVTLRGREARSILRFSITSTKVVSQAVLNLRYRASVTGLATNPTLDITLNGSNVSSLPVHDSQAEADGTATVQVPLPSDLFVHDNVLAFQWNAPCAAPCSGASNGEPWLRIETASELDTAGLMLPLPNRLSILPAPFFDPSVQRTLPLPFAFAASPDDQLLQAAGVVASWYGTLADFRGSHFPVSIGELPTGNVVVLAAADSPLAAQLGVTVSGPEIAIRDNPSDPYGKVLLVSGRDSAQILIAARALALGRFPRDTDQARIISADMPVPREAYDAPRWLKTTSSVKIAAKIPSDLLKAGKDGPAMLYFRLAPDLYFGSHSTVPLRVAYKTSGQFAERKVQFVLTLNGVFIASREVRLHSATDTQYQTFAIPNYLLYPSNTLAISITQARTKSAATFDDSLPDILIGRNTSLDLSGVTHYVRLPRMDLFAGSGFPFTRFADLSHTTVILPDRPSVMELGLYLDALGFFGAQTGYPGLRFQVANANRIDASEEKDFLVIGSGRDQRVLSRWSDLLPVQAANGHFAINESVSSYFELLGATFSQEASEKAKLAELLGGEIGPSFVLQQLSLSDTSSGVLITSASPDSSDPLFAMLPSGAGLGHITGGVTVLADGHFHSFKFGVRPFYRGSAPWFDVFECWMSFHIWLIPLVVILCAFLVSRRWNTFLEGRVLKRLEVAS